MVHRMDRRTPITPRRAASAGAGGRTPRTPRTPRTSSGAAAFESSSLGATSSSAAKPGGGFGSKSARGTVGRRDDLRLHLDAHAQEARSIEALRAFRHPYNATGTSLGHLSTSHPFGHSTHGAARASFGASSSTPWSATLKQLAASRAPPHVAAAMATAGAAGVPSGLAPGGHAYQQQPDGMATRDAQQRRWNAQKVMAHGSDAEGRRRLHEYAASHGLRMNAPRSYVSANMPMSGEPSRFLETCKADAVYARQSVAPNNLPGVLARGREATVMSIDTDGRFHAVNNLATGHLGYERFMRGIPPGYSGYIPRQIAQGIAHDPEGDVRSRHLSFSASLPLYKSAPKVRVPRGVPPRRGMLVRDGANSGTVATVVVRV